MCIIDIDVKLKILNNLMIYIPSSNGVFKTVHIYFTTIINTVLSNEKNLVLFCSRPHYFCSDFGVPFDSFREIHIAENNKLCWARNQNIHVVLVQNDL